MDEDCEAYELRMKKEDRINEMAAQEMGDGCKPCPKCEFRIVKNGGCNHMKWYVGYLSIDSIPSISHWKVT